MATVKQHYAEVLSDVYSWMLGGFDRGISKNVRFFEQHQLSPIKSGIAVDLGAGCGFQSIPLARLGFSVTAIDLDAKLLDELKANSGDLKITVVRDDLINFERCVRKPIELITCMTDTILHLQSKEQVISLFQKVFTSLEKKGKFIITFRDLSLELLELDRFIPLQSDDKTIFTCFLEYQTDTVKVHDLVYRKERDDWKLNKSFYHKLRLSKQWVDKQLKETGFDRIDSNINNGLVTIIAVK